MAEVTIVPAGKKVQQVIETVDPIAGYKIANKDDDASPNYYGFINAKGEWYILEETVSAGADTYRYARGANNFATNWTNRASLTYDYFDVVF